MYSQYVSEVKQTIGEYIQAAQEQNKNAKICSELQKLKNLVEVWQPQCTGFDESERIRRYNTVIQSNIIGMRIFSCDFIPRSKPHVINGNIHLDLYRCMHRSINSNPPAALAALPLGTATPPICAPAVGAQIPITSPETLLHASRSASRPASRASGSGVTSSSRSSVMSAHIPPAPPPPLAASVAQSTHSAKSRPASPVGFEAPHLPAISVREPTPRIPTPVETFLIQFNESPPPPPAPSAVASTSVLELMDPLYPAPVTGNVQEPFILARPVLNSNFPLQHAATKEERCLSAVIAMIEQYLELYLKKFMDRKISIDRYSRIYKELSRLIIEVNELLAKASSLRVEDMRDKMIAFLARIKNLPSDFWIPLETSRDKRDIQSGYFSIDIVMASWGILPLGTVLMMLPTMSNFTIGNLLQEKETLTNIKRVIDYYKGIYQRGIQPQADEVDYQRIQTLLDELITQVDECLHLQPEHFKYRKIWGEALIVKLYAEDLDSVRGVIQDKKRYISFDQFRMDIVTQSRQLLAEEVSPIGSSSSGCVIS